MAHMPHIWIIVGYSIWLQFDGSFGPPGMSRQTGIGAQKDHITKGCLWSCTVYSIVYDSMA